MGVEFKISDIIPVSHEAVFAAWLDSDEHSKMTGSPAKVSFTVGGKFEAWDQYIQGTNIEIHPYYRILQYWRTTEFEESDKDSRLEILFESAGEGAKVTIKHSGLPEHGMQYKQGWVDAYFTPMKAYFGGK